MKLLPPPDIKVNTLQCIRETYFKGYVDDHRLEGKMDDLNKKKSFLFVLRH